MASIQAYTPAVDYIIKTVPESLRKPKVAIICGSGLGGLADSVQNEEKIEIDYEKIPGFPRSTVEGHAGKLVFGFLADHIPIVMMVGRCHFYEGYDMNHITLPVRIFSKLGAELLIATNAAGGLNMDYSVGDIMLLNDHIFFAGLSGNHPLRGPNYSDFGPRFQPLSDAYDLELRRTIHESWYRSRIASSRRRLHEGVYAYVAGPSYETRAECRALRMMGADVVGMSTVPETIVARHCGMKVLAMSLVTNNAVLSPPPRGDDPLIQGKSREELEVILKEGVANHEEVIHESKLAAVDFQTYVVQAIKDIFPQPER